MGFWPGFTMGMYPSQFAYKKLLNIDMPKIWGNTSEVNLYYHVPFCKSKCPYCGFFSIVQNNDEFIMKYIDKVNEQALYYDQMFNNKVTNIKSICFGGGTPNLAPIEAYYKIFDTLSKMNICFDKNIEPSMEISPEIVTEDYIRQLHEIGIKRLSLGVQSLDENLRSTINRLNNYDLFQLVDIMRRYDMNIVRAEKSA